ncbi:hypothetical protein BJX63DRAFT_419722 [Aspergillus granulosus]|uniref:Nephrocystin 3-like N-terminal domain-containing protein n=1 Tax=Aspergillus granulosus TaxID=176169 RepID=A0ABR4HNV8_9EURO
MEPLSCAASVMAIIQLTGSIATICGGYIKEAKDAREEITSLQQGVTNLLGTFKKLEELVHSQDGKKLSTSEILVNEVTRCESVLTLVRKKIDPENTRKSTKAMRRLGLRALKWPLKRAEIESIIQDLERFKSSFIFALQVDQTFYGLETSQTSKRIEQIIDLEALPIVHGAEFNSYKDQHESECLPGTRTELCREIKEWAMSSNAKTIFWLNVLAGTGKSTISRTMAKSFHQDGLLGASFFFKRGEGDRGNATKFFPTITRQLVSKIPELLPAVKKALQDEPRIAHTPLKNQFENLVLQPLSTLDNITLQTPTLVIVLDALDECDNNDDIRAILRLLPRVQESTSLRLRVFVTSRPELPIRLGFRDVGTDHQDLILHEVSEPIVKHDISLFLKHKLATIRQERRLPPDWPGDENFQTLVRMSVPLFIFAATICRVFEDHYLDPLRSLNNILKYQTQESKLDATYLPVLERVVEKYEGKTQEDLIQDIQKIVDFLLDPYTRGKSPIWVDEKTTQETITAKCLSVMCKSLKKNMCNLQSYGMERRTMDSLAVSRSLPPELQYACRYWVHHLTHSESPKSWVNDIQAFLDEHFLHWMEVMSFLGLASEIVEGVSTLQSVLQGDNGSELSEFLFDAKRFTLKNSQIADISPLQIYASGLIFAPEMSITRRKFEKDLPNWIKKGPKIEENWSPELQTLEGHSSSVLSVAFSPDSRLLASGSSDNTIKLWDPASGALKYTLEGHSNWVQSVAFSPDGRLLARLLASSSYDKTIKLWDPASGALKHTINTYRIAYNIEFSKELPRIITNLGSFNIPAWHESFTSNSSKIENKISLQGGRWIEIRGQRELWLPPDYQAVSSAVKDGTIAFGCRSGRCDVKSRLQVGNRGQGSAGPKALQLGMPVRFNLRLANSPGNAIPDTVPDYCVRNIYIPHTLHESRLERWVISGSYVGGTDNQTGSSAAG